MEDEEYSYKNYQERKKAADENMQQMEADTKTWIEADTKVKDYMNKFQKTWAESFIKDYPKLKARFVRYGNELGDEPEKQQIAYLEDASERLLDIQLKKLFDVMCRWDAELLTLKGINTSWDFLPWQDDLLHCPFITPVTSEEVELYIRFMDTDEWEERDHVSLSDYESFRDENEDNERIPAWFKFENNHTDHHMYLELPMLRTKKEEFYHSLYRKDRDKEIERKYESGELKRYVSDDKPMISAHTYKDVERFIIEHEDKEVLIAFRKYYDYFTDQLIREDPKDQEEGWLAERVVDVFHYLTGIKDKIPVEASSDWRQGLIDAFTNYERRQIQEALPYAFSDYKMRLELKIGKPKKRNRYSDWNSHAATMNEHILRGRELNGEPRDFNY